MTESAGRDAGRIRVLDAQVVNQIAAGEVVERPASVVKELVENALDAGAGRVDVRVEDGGRGLVEVADDGWGMGPADLERVFLPHATSKVARVDDLLHVATLGFRGEALASIGSVAEATITSRAAGEESGYRVENREGRIAAVAPAAASPGTVVRVARLFAHVPARRKFLRTPATELGHISALMGRFALAFPHVAFRLRQGSRTLLETPVGEDRRGRIASVHGPELAGELLEVRAVDGEPALEAWIGPPALTRADTRLQQVFLNGRFVRDRTVLHALNEAYRDLLPPGGRRPVAFLFLTCDPGEVDVNVHPAKAEVRWRDAGAVHQVVRRALRAALEDAPPGTAIPLVDREAPAQAERRRAAAEFAFTRGVGRPAPTAEAPRPGSAGVVREGPAPQAEPVEEAGALRPLGQALGTYLVLEDDDALVVIDQHALHERVLFDRINERLRSEGNLEVQRLLVPVVVHLDQADCARLGEAEDLLQTLGWVVEPFGADAVAVRGVPAVLKRPDPEGALEALLQVLSQGRRDGLDRTALLGAAVDSLACRAAVMAGDRLHPEEVLALLGQAEALNHSHSCPHGRPTRLTLKRGDLERWFHRV